MKREALANYGFAGFFIVTLALSIAWLSEPAKVADAQSLTCLKPGESIANDMFIKLARDVNPVVVNISTSMAPRQMQPRGGGGRGGAMPRDPFFDMFEEFMDRRGMQPPQQQQAQQALGTGFIIRKDGLILTNNHVIEQADIIQVQLAEGEKTLHQAKVIGRDGRTDIALIKIDPKKPLPEAKFGSSKSAQVGEWVAAFGNPFGHGHSMTKGIISAIGRELNEINRFPFIQTDASINPGNSGGPLVNSCGEVIGVNTAIDARAQGIGFAIPIDEVKAILPALEKEGSIKRAFLGVRFYPEKLDPRARAELKIPVEDGALIVGVEDETPAARAGLKEYDFITKFGAKDIESGDDFRRSIEDASVGSAYDITFYRNGEKRTAKVTLRANDDIAQQPSASAKQPAFPGAKQAPHGLGFKVAMLTPESAYAFGIQINRPAPVITLVEPKSPAGKAGLRPGDIVVDVNRQKATRDTDVLRLLKAGQTNSVRIFRGQLPMLIYVAPK